MRPTSPTRRTAAALAAAFGPSPFTRDAAVTIGISVDRLRQAVLGGLVVRIRRGWYVIPVTSADAEDPADSPPGRRVRAASADTWAERIAPTPLSVLLELRARDARPVLAGALAARWWGLDVVARDTRQPGPVPLILVPPDAGVRRGTHHGILIRSEELHPDDVVPLSPGIAVTSVLRTGLDCARHQDPIPAFIAVNSAMRRSLDSSGQFLEPVEAQQYRLTRLAGEPGAQQAAVRRMLEALDRTTRRGLSAIPGLLDVAEPRLESALEALSWWRFHESGLVLPVPQQWIRGASGRRYRVDFDFGQALGEADGMGKYAHPAQLRAEKQRQLDIELVGKPVIRWGWHDMWGAPGRVIAVLLRAA